MVAISYKPTSELMVKHTIWDVWLCKNKCLNVKDDFFVKITFFYKKIIKKLKSDYRMYEMCWIIKIIINRYHGIMHAWLKDGWFKYFSIFFQKNQFFSVFFAFKGALTIDFGYWRLWNFVGHLALDKYTLWHIEIRSRKRYCGLCWT